jgi:hypothetical protein
MEKKVERTAANKRSRRSDVGVLPFIQFGNIRMTGVVMPPSIPFTIPNLQQFGGQAIIPGRRNPVLTGNAAVDIVFAEFFRAEGELYRFRNLP